MNEDDRPRAERDTEARDRAGAAGPDGESGGDRDGGDAPDRFGAATDPTEERIERIPIDARAVGGEGETETGLEGADDGSVFGPEPSSAPVEAGSPSLEHALFVLLGALATVLVFVLIAQALLGG